MPWVPLVFGPGVCVKVCVVLRVGFRFQFASGFSQLSEIMRPTERDLRPGWLAALRTLITLSPALTMQLLVLSTTLSAAFGLQLSPAAARAGPVRMVGSWFDQGARLTPPTPAVGSWYDAGMRLTAEPATAEPAATDPAVKEWPSLGGSGAWHPMRGPWPKTSAREQWVPPAGWKPPTKPVLSWYDMGKRLEAAAPAMGSVKPTGGTYVAPAPAGFEWGETY